MSDHSNKFEKLETKSNSRTLILSQFKEYFQLLPKDTSSNIKIATLPGKEFKFESLLEQLSKDFPNLTITVDAREKISGIFYDRTFCPYELGWSNRYSSKNFNIDYSKQNFTFRSNANIYWADLCGEPSESFLKTLEKEIKEVDLTNRLLYFTFSTACRWPDPRISTMIYKNKDPLQTNELCIRKALQSILGDNSTLIMHHEYYSVTSDYSNHGTPMVVLGWHMLKNSPISKILSQRPVYQKASFKRLISGLGWAGKFDALDNAKRGVIFPNIINP